MLKKVGERAVGVLCSANVPRRGLGPQPTPRFRCAEHPIDPLRRRRWGAKKIDFVQPLHNNLQMSLLHRRPNMTIRANVPDHLPPHVHGVMADRRDALVDLATLGITSRSLRASDIAPALAWIGVNCAYCVQFFKECNP